MNKICAHCLEAKDLSLFPKLERRKHGVGAVCRSCLKIYAKEYREKNKETLAIKRKIYLDSKLNKLDEEKSTLLSRVEKEKKYCQNYYQNNREKLRNKVKVYQQNNKEKINKRSQEKKEKDPLFRLRTIISSRIATILKKNGGQKNSSIVNYLDYSIDELKSYIESKFEPWMNWDNQGVYNAREWREDDLSTWKWQLDHIIPHSLFKYSSLDHPDFKKCWSLSNLRPLSAKQNILDGVRRVRHKGVNI